jgi:small subunit ribosomal protein S5
MEDWSFKQAMDDKILSENKSIDEQGKNSEAVASSSDAGIDIKAGKVLPENSHPVQETAAPAPAVESKGRFVKGARRNEGRRKNPQDQQVSPEFMEKVIAINRITKVTKGGKKMSFSALVVVGDMKGRVGYSLSKASEVATAIRKAMGVAKKNMISVPMRGSTIPHEIIGQCSGSRVLLKPASEGTGVIAAGPVRAVCDGVGIHNILSKCHRSNNPINVVKATMEGLSRLKSIEKTSV